MSQLRIDYWIYRLKWSDSSTLNIDWSDLRSQNLRMMEGLLLLVILPFCHETKSWKQVMDSNPEWESGINRDFSSKNIFSELRSEKLRMMEGLLLLVILPSCHETKSCKQVMDSNPEWESGINRDVSTTNIFSELRSEKLRMMEGLLLLVILPSWHQTKSWKQVMDSNPEWEPGINRDFFSKHIFFWIQIWQAQNDERSISSSHPSLLSWNQVMEASHGLQSRMRVWNQ